MWDKRGWLNFSVKGYPQRFYCSYVWSCSSYNRRTCFCTGLISRKLCWLLLMSSTGIISLSILLSFLYWSPLLLCSFLFYLSRSLYTIYCFANIFCIVDNLAKRLVTFFMILKELIHFYENCIKFAVCIKHEVAKTGYDFIHRIWFNLWYSFTVKLILWNGMLKYGILFKIYMESCLKYLIDKDLTKDNIEKQQANYFWKLILSSNFDTVVTVYWIFTWGICIKLAMGWTMLNLAKIPHFLLFYPINSTLDIA